VEPASPLESVHHQSALFNWSTAPAAGRIRNVSAAAQGADDLDVAVRADGMARVPHHPPIDEEPDVGPNAILLVDDAEADAGEAAVEIGDEIGQCGALDVDGAGAAGIAVQRRRDPDAHQSMVAAPIEWICGRWAAMQHHEAPSSPLAQISPPVVPK